MCVIHLAIEHPLVHHVYRKVCRCILKTAHKVIQNVENIYKTVQYKRYDAAGIIVHTVTCINLYYLIPTKALRQLRVKKR